MEARDRQAGDREAFGIAARLIEAHLEDTKHSNGWSIPRLASARVRLERMVTQLRAAAAVEDAPNLNDCIDGTPLPGKCQDPTCTGPHTSFEDEAPQRGALLWTHDCPKVNLAPNTTRLSTQRICPDCGLAAGSLGAKVLYQGPVAHSAG